MRALTLQGSKFAIEELPDPVPEQGQILVAPFYNGICGSDLHMRTELREAERKGDKTGAMPKLVLGHEFSSEIVGIAPGTQTDLKVGDRVVGLPFTPLAEPPGFANVGLHERYSGGTGSLCVLDAVRSFRIPDSIPSDLAALTEPLSVGQHAARLAARQKGPNIIIGCGPVGIAVLLALKDQGRGPIIAADFSQERREIASALGADLVIDPAQSSPYEGWHGIEFEPDPISPLLPREFVGTPRGLNIFECTGAPKVFQEIMAKAPAHSHIIYAGVCMHEVKHVPVEATLRELTVEYSFAYTPKDFRSAIDMIKRQADDVSRLITSCVPLARAEQAFDALTGTPKEIKVLLDVRA